MSTHTDDGKSGTPKAIGSGGNGADLTFAGNFDWLSGNVLKSTKDGVAMLESNAEEFKQSSFNGLVAASEETSSYVAMVMGMARSDTASSINLVADLAKAKIHPILSPSPVRMRIGR